MFFQRRHTAGSLRKTPFWSNSVGKRPLRLEALEDRRLLSVMMVDSQMQAGAAATSAITTLNSAPTDIILSNATVSNHAPVGTLVGTLAAVDPDVGDTHTFSLLDNAGGHFAISTNQLYLANATMLSAGSYNVTVQTTDSGGLTFDKLFAITVTDPGSQTALGWALKVGGAGVNGGGAVATDAAGNVYMAGFFTGPVTFGTTSLNGNAYAAKYTSSGSLVWAKALTGTFGTEGAAMTVNAAGNVYFTGDFTGTVNFNPGSGTSNLSSANAESVFVLKLDTNGNFVWAKQFASTTGSEAHGIAVDGNGNVYVAGGFSGTVDFNPGSATYNLTSAGGLDAFVAKLDSSGNFVWADRFGGTGDDIAYGLAVDSANVYTTGYFNGTVDFNPGTGTANLASANGEGASSRNST